MTLETLLGNVSDGDLLDIFLEIDSGVVPATGSARAFCRRINKMIDKGELCINPSTYRKVYLPTLAKTVYKEMSKRFAHAVQYGKL